MKWTKRQFFSAGAFVCLARPVFSQGVPRTAKVDRGPALEAPLVKEFVGVAHGKFEQTEQMLTQTPSLLNATWDWGGGDFETGLGGASHMGNKEIAKFLISKGARMDIFVAAMLGKLNIVKPMIEAYPALKTSKGPHGIPLLTHAEKGGDNAASVVEYLKSVGAG